MSFSVGVARVTRDSLAASLRRAFEENYPDASDETKSLFDKAVLRAIDVANDLPMSDDVLNVAVQGHVVEHPKDDMSDVQLAVSVSGRPVNPPTPKEAPMRPNVIQQALDSVQ